MKLKEDLKILFFSPPSTIKERLSLFIMLFLTFIFFFNPLKFSDFKPIDAFMMSLFPSMSISWGWIVFLRYKSNRN